MNRYVLGTVFVLLLAIGGVVGLFWVQNASREVLLSLDLGFMAWKLANPIPVPALIAASFGIGFLGGSFLFLFRALGQGRKIRRLEQELALSATNGSSSSWR